MALEITSVTISADFGDKEYGSGTESFMNITAKCPVPVPIEGIDEVILDGLDMYFACWSTLLASRWTTGVISAEDFNKRKAVAVKRLEQVRKIYKKEITSE